MTQEDQITSGMLQWEPGSLSRSVLERILRDALADLWADCYRRGDSRRDQAVRYRAAVKLESQCAVGEDVLFCRE